MKKQIKILLFAYFLTNIVTVQSADYRSNFQSFVEQNKVIDLAIRSKDFLPKFLRRNAVEFAVAATFAAIFAYNKIFKNSQKVVELEKQEIQSDKIEDLPTYLTKKYPAYRATRSGEVKPIKTLLEDNNITHRCIFLNEYTGKTCPLYIKIGYKDLDRNINKSLTFYGAY